MPHQAFSVAERAYLPITETMILQGSGSDLMKDPAVRAAYFVDHGSVKSRAKFGRQLVPR